ncbi:hypothetical protein [Demequina aurantiaca]|uniref:hypothetical protein n=1 Tax=Demequina aurantiaca TaxID=676200 RepID=UPI003D359755
MKILPKPIIGAAVLVVLLTACSSGDASSDGSAAPTASTAATQTPGDAPSGEALAGDQAAGNQARGALTGEVAYVDDAVLQVQDGSLQTAVRYTDATTVTEQTDISLGDIAVGNCVVGAVDDAGAVVQLAVSESVDGECVAAAGGFAGGQADRPSGDAPDGDAPDGGLPGGDAPAGELPDGAERPTAPDDAAAAGDQGALAATLVAGTVTAVTEEGLEVEDTDGTATEVSVTADATLTSTVSGSAADIEVGMCVTARGEADDAGGYDATALALSTPGDEGCVSVVEARGGRDAQGGGQGGGQGGAPGADAPAGSAG